MKHNQNPFQAFESIGRKHTPFKHTANLIINHIATINGLTVEELKAFVGWCEANKRVNISSSKTSLELWGEALRHS
ncbi:hypothetical protein [Paenibacillus sp. FSL H3-0286]|uniref:hypothetical protein n=1 Tax=Paenibacillus sp. FSL H3-0286 TaxID=2921427 RepID=UPI003246CE73